MTSILPRFIRHRDAPAYLGIDRNRFDAEVRPNLVEIPIGDRGIAFDRHDLDSWADEYKARHGKLGHNLVAPQSQDLSLNLPKSASNPAKKTIKNKRNTTAVQEIINRCRQMSIDAKK